MKELFESIWNAPKEDVISVLNGIAIAYFVIAVIGVIAIAFLFWKLK